jgi:dCTP diphosphatase
MNKDQVNLGLVKKRLREFSIKRDWEQFHSPKNLAMALSVEASELVELFQWADQGGHAVIKDPKQKEKVEKEIADIFNYLVKFADMLDMDLEKQALSKIEENSLKYPVSKVKGKAVKYRDL